MPVAQVPPPLPRPSGDPFGEPPESRPPRGIALDEKLEYFRSVLKLKEETLAREVDDPGRDPSASRGTRHRRTCDRLRAGKETEDASRGTFDHVQAFIAVDSLMGKPARNFFRPFLQFFIAQPMRDSH